MNIFNSDNYVDKKIKNGGKKMMKKRKVTLIVAIIILIAAIIFAATRLLGGGAGVYIDNKPEQEVKGNNNTLVAYFSWSGHGQQMARWISDETGADLFRIVPGESYGEDYNACADRAKNELDNGIRPELAEHIDANTMAQYDTIYLVFPVWWYDLPMPVWTFLEEYNLAGKTIIPCFSHNGSSSGANSLNRVAELAKGANVRTGDALSISGNSVANSEKEIRDWAKSVLNK